jgi:SnoaL-like polyketide cyclase
LSNVDIIRRYTEECWGKGNLDLVEELVAPDARPGFGFSGTGPQAYRDEILATRGAFSDYRTKVEEIFSAADAVAVRWSTTGRHTGALFGNPPTGKDISIVGVEIFHVRDGRIVDHYGERLVPTLLGQIGALPVPAGA